MQATIFEGRKRYSRPPTDNRKLAAEGRRQRYEIHTACPGISPEKSRQALKQQLNMEPFGRGLPESMRELLLFYAKQKGKGILRISLNNIKSPESCINTGFFELFIFQR